MESPRRLIHIVSANTWGGGERYALDVCRQFQSEGWDCLAYTRDARVVDKIFRTHEVPVRHAPLQGYFDIPSALMLSRVIKSDPTPTILHVHKYKDAFTALLARKLARRPDVAVVITRHLVRPGKDSAILRRIYRNVSAQIFVSQLAMDEFLSTWDGRQLPLSADRLYMLHNSINVRPQPLMPLPSSGPIIAMYHGRLSPEKGLETLISALPALKGRRMRLWIAGTGDSDYADSLHRLAQSLGVNSMIDWKGHIDDIHSLIPKVHFGVLPSVAQEAFGLTNIEYMAHGRAQICTSNGAQSEYLTDGSEAILVAPSDSRSLSDAMIGLCRDLDLCKTLGQNAYHRFYDTLSWPRFTSFLKDIYNRALLIQKPIFDD